MIHFEIPEEPVAKLGVTETPEIVITISGVNRIDAMHIIFNPKQDEEEETEDE